MFDETSYIAMRFPSSDGVYHAPSTDAKPGKAIASKKPMKNRSAYIVLAFLAPAIPITRIDQKSSQAGMRMEGRRRVARRIRGTSGVRLWCVLGLGVDGPAPMIIPML